MRRFLSHDKTKADLAKYLAEEVVKKKTKSSKLIITLASGHTRGVYSAAIFQEFGRIYTPWTHKKQ